MFDPKPKELMVRVIVLAAGVAGSHLDDHIGPSLIPIHPITCQQITIIDGKIFRGKRKGLEDVPDALFHEVGDVGVELKTDDPSSRGLPEIEEDGPEDIEIIPEGQKGCEEGDLISIR